MAKKEMVEKKNKGAFWSKVLKFFKRIGFAIAGLCVRIYQDISRVRWPNKKSIISATCIVLSFVVLFGLYILVDDFIIAQIFKVIY